MMVPKAYQSQMTALNTTTTLSWKSLGKEPEKQEKKDVNHAALRRRRENERTFKLYSSIRCFIRVN